MTAASAADNDRLIRKRDDLLIKLRRRGEPGVVSAGLTRERGETGIVIFVKPGFVGKIPDTFDGVGVIVAPAVTVSGI